MLQLVRDTPLDNEQREYVDLAVKSTDRLNRLLSDILDLSRIEADKLELRQREFELREVMHSIRDIFAHVCNKNKNTLSVDIQDSVPQRLIGDDTRLTQVLFNRAGSGCRPGDCPRSNPDSAGCFLWSGIRARVFRMSN
jgi:signal transduction histidine kinase